MANGNFEKYAEETLIPDNWKFNKSSTPPSEFSGYENQIWLGELASKTQGHSYKSVESIETNLYKVSGPGNAYVYFTDQNYDNCICNTGTSDDRQDIEGVERPIHGWNTSPSNGVDGRTGYVNKVIDGGENKGKSLELGFVGAYLRSAPNDKTDYGLTDGKISSSFGIEAVSEPFELHEGDQLGFDWKATFGGDHYEVYGFIVKVADIGGTISPSETADELNTLKENHEEIFYGRGNTQDWKTETGTVTEDGIYRFRFVSGSFNATDGTTYGATLAVDNIRILNGKLNANFVEEIGQLVTYETTKLLGDRKINITATNGIGEIGNSTTVHILMDNEFERSLTIEEPSEDAIVYNPMPGINGKVLEGSTVGVTVSGPNGYSHSSGYVTESNGEWKIDTISELTEPGIYTISANATNVGMSGNPLITSTFVFVNKDTLEKYVEQVNDLAKDDYQAGWEDDETDSDVEFLTALTNAENLLEDIEDTTDGSNPDQATVDQALMELMAAKEALEKHSPKETHPATYKHGENEITIDFDKKITLTNTGNPTEGFIVTVDDVEYEVTSAFTNEDKVTLIVEHPLDSDAETVEVVYTKNDSRPNLVGDEENGSADETFTVVAKDHFGAGLQIHTTIGDTDDQTPVFTGIAHDDADEVSLMIYNSPTGAEVLTNITATLKADGTWTYTIPEGSKLDYGTYTFEVEATDHEGGPRTVTKSANFTVVDKRLLNEAVESAGKLSEEDHRAGWETFKDELDRANIVLTNPIATQDEVDQAIADLEIKRDALEKYPPKVEKATFNHGFNEIIVEFDKDVKFVNGAIDSALGFTVTMDGIELDVVEAVADGNEVTLTLDGGTKLSSDAEIEIIYNEANGRSNLVGDEENGTPTEDAAFRAYDFFGAALQITGTKGNTDDRTTPFNGEIHPDTDSLRLTILDDIGTKHVENAVGNINGVGWIFEDWTGLDELVPGNYLVHVTAIDDDTGRIVTKTANFTVVDKRLLDEAVESAEKLTEEDHRAGWETFKDELDRANIVLTNPIATQDEVDQAIADLEIKRDALEKYPPEAKKATFNHGFNKIVLVFEKDVKFSNGSIDSTLGFTVTMDGIELDVVGAVSNGNEVILTLVDGTKLSSDAAVEIIYNEANGLSNLVGDEENGTPVEDFSFQAGDPFGFSLQIDEPNGITNDTTPIIEGTADPSTEGALITITGPDGEKIVIDSEGLTINADGTWIYEIKETLAPGVFQVEVTTSITGRPDVTKYHYFTVVDKSELIAIVDNINSEKLVENEYTENSWTHFEEIFEHATDVIADPEATQDEVNEANADLERAYEGLVYKVALEEVEKESKNLVSKHYSNASWSEYQSALAYARKVLGSPASTQKEVDAAEARLEAARKALTVDKTRLEEEENQSNHLKSKDYSKESWSNYVQILKDVQAVLNDPNTTQDVVDKAMKSLEEAHAALVVDKKPLEEEAAKSKQLNEDNYTSKSWVAYQKAFKNAQAVLTDENATQMEVDKALARLTEARHALEKEQELPNTATNIYNYLMLGLVLLLLGFVLLIVQVRGKRE